MLYRREIDGLRALAVLPVILFHAGFSTFSGGFVGVDVFFVISGYLITSIIFSEKSAGTFTLANFYERRARRILPALFLVLAFCLPFAWLWLLPQDLKKFSSSLAAVILFISNHFFSNQSAYFDAATELKPLLHTWSLAVEEQYYLFFPAAITLAWRLGTRWLFGSMALIALLSLGLAQWLSPINPTSAFFILPTRAWELLMGALTVFYFSNQHKWQITTIQHQLGSVLGLSLLVGSIMAFDHQTPYPSLYTLAPTVGTVLMIVFATPQTLVGQLLGTPVLVGIGLVSYSAYLWHQPLFAFARHQHIGEPSQSLLGLLTLATFALAHVSWKYVETPFRNNHRFSRQFIFRLFIFGSLFFGSIAIYGYRTKGLPDRPHMQAYRVLSFDSATLGYKACQDKHLTEGEKLNHCQLTSKGPINAALIGDSHADDKFFGLDQQVTSLRWMLIGNSSCPPLLGVDVVGIEHTCRQKFEKITRWLSEQNDIHTVAISYWAQYPQTTPYAADHLRMKLNADTIKISSAETPLTDRNDLFNYGLQETVRQLLMAKKRVIIMIDIPELPYFPIDCIKGRPNCVDSLSNVQIRQAQHRAHIAKLKQQFAQLLIFDPTDLFCDASTCRYTQDGVVLYRDSHHLTLNGSSLYGQKFSAWLNQQPAVPH